MVAVVMKLICIIGNEVELDGSQMNAIWRLRFPVSRPRPAQCPLSISILYLKEPSSEVPLFCAPPAQQATA